jgi:hypothetical protein
MKKWANELNRTVSKKDVQNGWKTHEEMLDIPGNKGNTNQNSTSVLLE